MPPPRGVTPQRRSRGHATVDSAIFYRGASAIRVGRLISSHQNRTVAQVSRVCSISQSLMMTAPNSMLHIKGHVRGKEGLFVSFSLLFWS